MADSDLWEAEFPITSVTRADLVRAGAPRAVARAVTNKQMRAIARKMREYYVEHPSGQFWEHLQTATEDVLLLNHPKQQLHSTPQTTAGPEVS